MKKMKWKNLLAAIAIVAAIVAVQSCKEDDPTPLELSTVTAGSLDLNGATSPSNVPVDATISITFTTDVDATTATSSNIKLLRDYDDTDIPLTITAAGNTVTIDPVADLTPGSLFVLSVSEGLKSDKGLALTALSRNFTTAGTFAPEGVIAHWTFENVLNSVVGTFAASTTLSKDVTFADSRNAAAGKAASFNGTTSIIEIPNGELLMASNDFTLSFWVKASSTKNGHFVMGLGAWQGFQFEIDGAPWTQLTKSVKLATQYNLGTTTAGEDTWWNGDGKTRDNDGWMGSTFNKDVSTVGVGSFFIDKWAHVVCTYAASTKVGRMFVNGEKTREWNFNLWPDGDPKRNATGVKFAGNTTGGGNNFAIGFIQASGNRIISDTWADPADPLNNHFKGLVDDIRIFNKAVTEQEVTLIYNSEK